MRCAPPLHCVSLRCSGLRALHGTGSLCSPRSVPCGRARILEYKKRAHRTALDQIGASRQLRIHQYVMRNAQPQVHMPLYSRIVLLLVFSASLELFFPFQTMAQNGSTPSFYFQSFLINPYNGARGSIDLVRFGMFNGTARDNESGSVEAAWSTAPSPLTLQIILRSEASTEWFGYLDVDVYQNRRHMLALRHQHFRTFDTQSREFFFPFVLLDPSWCGDIHIYARAFLIGSPEHHFSRSQISGHSYISLSCGE